MKAYHGSASVFDKFDHSFTGSGEGAQSYGWGTYVTTDLSVSKHYADVANLMGGYYYINDERVPKEVYVAVEMAINRIDNNRSKGRSYQISELLNCLNAMHETYYNLYQTRKDNPKYDSYDVLKLENKVAMLEQGIGYLSELEEKTDTVDSTFSKKEKMVYEVEIPDDNGNNYLPFNKPNRHINEIADRLGINEKFETLEELQDYLDKNRNICSPKQLAKLMESMGFVGIRMPIGYLSGNVGKGYNYVIFNEKDIMITDTYELMEAKKIKGNNEIPPYEADEFTIGDEGGNLEYAHVITEVINSFIKHKCIKKKR